MRWEKRQDTRSALLYAAIWGIGFPALQYALGHVSVVGAVAIGIPLGGFAFFLYRWPAFLTRRQEVGKTDGSPE
jgi:hypothetical protein